MPGKRTAELYTYLRCDTEWDSFIANTPGFLVIDIYAEWCGTCKAVLGIFKRFKHNHRDAIHFAAVEADAISYLEAYRGRCQPTFHMYAGVVMVGVIHGSKGAQIEERMLELLATESKIESGQAVRVEVVDSEIFLFRQSESQLTVGAPAPPEGQEATLALIKPDAVQAGMAGDILGEIAGEGLEVLAQKEMVLTARCVEELYGHLREQPQFPELVAFMTGGPSICLALSRPDQGGQGPVEALRSLVGPCDATLARAEAPSCLRARYGTDALRNAIHASGSREQAARELELCFPELGAPRGEQGTLAVLRLESLRGDREEVMGRIREAGFEIACARELLLGEQELQELGQEGRASRHIARYMLDTPLLALSLCRENAVRGWLDMIAGGTLGTEGALYGSQEGEGDLDLFFPMEQTVAVIKPNAMPQKGQVLKRIDESGFRIVMQREACLTQELVSTLYPVKSGCDFYDSLAEFMCSGPSLMLVLSKRDAVSSWRSLIGPVDPSEGREIAPSSLRAVFGKDILQNGLHGCSSRDRVQGLIKALFPD